MRMKDVLVIIVLLVAGGRGYCQDSLIHYLDIAIKSNQQILQKYYEYEAALQKIPQVSSLSDPEINAGVFLSPMELVTGNQVAELQLMQMFPWFGTLRAAKDEMSLMANAAYESFRDTKLQVLFDMQKTWFSLYQINKEIGIGNENLEILRSIERLSRVRFITVSTGNSSGSMTRSPQPGEEPENSNAMQGMQQGRSVAPGEMATGSSDAMESSGQGSGLIDLFSVLVEIGDMENTIALLENRQRAVKAQFNSFLNRPAQYPVVFPDTLISDTLYHEIGNVMPDSFLLKNPMLTMQEYEKKSTKARKRMVSRMGYPMFGLGLNYAIMSRNEMLVSEMNGRDMIMPMITLTLPVYRKKYRSMKAEAGFLTEAAQREYQTVYNNLNTEYYQAVQLYEDAIRRIKLFRDQSDLTRKSLNISMQGFASSGSGLTDVLRLQQRLLDYEVRHVAAVTDFNTAVSWLKRLAGN